MDPGSGPYRDDREVQLGQIGDDDDATCNASSEGVFAYVEAKKHCELLSQREAFKVFAMSPPISQLGQIGDDSDATCSGSSGGVLGIR